MPSPLVRCLIGAALAAWPALASGCLDASQGQTGAVGQPAAAVPLPGCDTAPVPQLEHISQFVGQVALGRCGHLAWVDHRGIQQLQVIGPDGRSLAGYPEENGWFGQLTFSDAGDRLSFASYRSDLGFGDHTVVAMDAPRSPQAVIPFDGDGGFGFFASGAWSCDDGGVGGGDTPHLDTVTATGTATLAAEIDCYALQSSAANVVVPTDAGELRWFDLPSARDATIDGYSPQWVEGDTYRGRDAFVVSGDGTRVAIGNIAEGLPGIPHGVGGPFVRSARVYTATDDGLVATTLRGDIEGAKTAAGSPIVLLPDGDGGASWLDASGAPQRVPAATPLTLLGATGRALVEVPSPKGGGAYGVLDLDTQVVERLTDTTGGWRLSASGAAIVLSHVIDGAPRISVYRPAAGLTELARPAASPRLHWVGDDGSVLASLVPMGAVADPGDGCVPEVLPDPTPMLLSPTGATRWTGTDVREIKRITQAGGVLLIAARLVNDRLTAVDIATGRAADVLDGHDFRVQTDGAGARIAVTYVPLSGTTDHLQFGATPRP